MFDKAVLILPFISVFLTIIAGWMTYRNLTLSVKQSLFDKRLENYLLFLSLKSSFESDLDEITDQFSKDNGSYVSNATFAYKALTDNNYLDSISEAIIIRSKLTNSTDDIDSGLLRMDSSESEKLISKMNWLESQSVISRYVFSEKLGNPISDFISEYHELIMCLYKYQNVANIISVGNLDFKDNRYTIDDLNFNGETNVVMDIDELRERVNELSHRLNVESKIDNIKEILQTISDNKILNKIDKEIRIKRRGLI